MLDVHGSIERACGSVPGLVQAAVAILPEGILIGGLGAKRAFDHEPLVRSAALCLVERPAPNVAGKPAARFVEYLFSSDDELVVIQGGRRDARLVLAVVCRREANLAWVLGSTRRALHALEDSLDLSALGV